MWMGRQSGRLGWCAGECIFSNLHLFWIKKLNNLKFMDILRILKKKSGTVR